MPKIKKSFFNRLYSFLKITKYKKKMQNIKVIKSATKIEKTSEGGIKKINILFICCKYLPF